MTPDRLRFLIDDCFGHQRGRPGFNLEAHYGAIAAFFGVEPQTLRRWRTGRTPIPRSVEVVMEIFHAYPQVTADAINNVIRARDRDDSRT